MNSQNSPILRWVIPWVLNGLTGLTCRATPALAKTDKVERLPHFAGSLDGEQVALQKMRCHWCQKCKSLCLAEIWYMVILIYIYNYTLNPKDFDIWVRYRSSHGTPGFPQIPNWFAMVEIPCRHPYVDHSVGMESLPRTSHMYSIYIYNCIINVYNMIIVSNWIQLEAWFSIVIGWD